MDSMEGESSQAIFVGGYDTDEISLTSTVEEEGGTYEMEEILSELPNPNSDGEMVYLLKWVGYPLNQSTWEPEENLDDPETTLVEWEAKKAAIDRKEVKAFDVKSWFIEHDELIHAKGMRKQKREKKRAKIKAQEKEAEKSRSHSKGTANPTLRHDSPEPASSTSAQAKPAEVPPSRRKSTFRGFVDDDSEENDDDVPLIPKRRRINRQASSANDSDIECSTTTSGQKQRDTNQTRSRTSSFQKASQHPTKTRQPFQKGNAPLTVDVTSSQDDQNTQQDPATGTPSSIETSPHTGGSESAQNTRSTKNVLDNWTHEPPRRFRPRANPNVPNMVGENGAKNFSCYSTMSRYQSYGKNEPPPDMSAISWTDSRTGKPIKNNSSVVPVNTVKPKQPEDELSIAPQVSGPSPTSHHSRAEMPQLSREDVVLLAREKNKIPMTCYNWHMGYSCEFSEEECRYFHVETGQLGSQKGKETHLPKYKKPPLTCFYWYENGHCNLSDDECAWAHWETGLVAGPTSRMAPRKVDKNSRPKQPSGLTCFFWSRGNCNNTESKCKYEHRLCDKVAPPPRNWADSDHRNFEPSPEHQEEPMDIDAAPISHEPYQRVNHPVESGPLTPTPQSKPLSAPDTMTNSVSQEYPRAAHAHIIHLAVPSAGNSDDVIKIEAQLVLSSDHVKRDFRAALDTALTTYRSTNASQQTSNLSLFQVDRSIIAEDLKKFSTLSPDDVLFSGDIFPTLSGAEALDRYSNDLVLQTGAALTYFPSIDNPAFTVIMCPPSNRVDAWKFLSSGRDSVVNAVLQFVVTKPLSKSLANMSLTEITPSNDPATHAEVLFSRFFKKNLGDLFIYPSPGIAPLDKKVLLMFPHTLTADIQFVSSIFEAYGCEVFLGHLTGVFHYFLKEIPKGIVVFHPFFLQFHKIPNLSSTLLNKKYNFHEIGPDRDLLWATNPREELAHHWLFPHGGVVFLTDHVIEFAPKEAFDVIQQFTEKRVRKAPFKNWRLFLRPGARNWAWKLAERHQAQAEQGNDWTRYKIAMGIEELMGRDLPLSDDGFSDTDSDENLVISPSKRMMPEIGEWWEQGIEGKEKATDHMVQYFCGWVITKVREFRRFIIVHPKEKPEWRQKYQHISLVTPEKYIQKF